MEWKFKKKKKKDWWLKQFSVFTMFWNKLVIYLKAAHINNGICHHRHLHSLHQMLLELYTYEVIIFSFIKK